VIQPRHGLDALSCFVMTTLNRPDLGVLLEDAAKVFAVLGAPMRLRILSSLCHGEKNVGQLLADVQTTQPNVSQHLNLLYRAGLLRKRRDGVQIFYAIADDHVVRICQAMCEHVATRRH
jgi:DNA-binding transcriptional ArsR family regulator